jgi:hypothetical protein
MKQVGRFFEMLKTESQLLRGFTVECGVLPFLFRIGGGRNWQYAHLEG